DSNEEKPEPAEKFLAYASFPIFTYEGILRQGPLLIPLSKVDSPVVQSWGSRPLYEPNDLCALVMLPTFQDFSSLGCDTQQWLMDIIETGVTHSLSQDEKEILWEKRYYLTRFPQALTLVLASAIGWDWASLNNVYQLVDEWTPLDPVQAVELLLPQQLQQRIDHCPERWFVYRCAILQDKIFDAMDDNMHVDIKNQRLLLEAKHIISKALFYLILVLRFQNLDWLDASILANNVRLPILPSFVCSGINVHECSFFNSLTKPLKISFKGLKTSYDVLYKVGDDVRQDALVLQLVRIMNDIWLSQELDLRMIVFRCMPVGKKAGMIELVSECRTLCEIQSALGATGVFKDDILKKWLEKQNPTEFQYKIALENFQLSCAGWCVATYVLGIGDRHNDNILITKSGHVFHIDFGKYMGDWQTAAGFRRDRTPFIFTAEMAYVINEGSPQSATDHYQHFVDNCCKAFNLLRKKYSLLVTLIKMMSCSGIPGMSMDAVNFVQNNLLLDVSDTEATVQFTRMIQESLKSKFPRLNFFAHTLVQLRNSSFIRGSYDDPDKLSFIPEIYSERSDGRISNVAVLAFEKWRNPEKVYMYKIRVERVNETVSSIVYRSFDEFSELYCDLVYTFFHIIYRDNKMDAERSSLVTGRIYLSISYDQQKFILSVFIGHVQGLHAVNGHAPDSYVKTYLLPSMKRSTKRKTRVVKNTQTPTFNEELTYRLGPGCCLADYSLEVSVWSYGSIVSENMMIGAVLIPLHKLDRLLVNRKGVKCLQEWFTLNGFKS
uniref:PI3K/PI4K domain-containing protein n=1 Tax=Syphacia muris TaxID=451379 RepID=A0A158R675_9BILA